MNYVPPEYGRCFYKANDQREILNSFKEHYGNSVKFAETELYIVSL